MRQKVSTENAAVLMRVCPMKVLRSYMQRIPTKNEPDQESEVYKVQPCKKVYTVREPISANQIYTVCNIA